MNGSAGFILFDKPGGVTSFTALGTVKRALGSRRVGHTGTLDKFADGLLLVLCGFATRLARFTSGMTKRYRAVVRFGVATDTLDPEGTTVATGPVPDEGSVRRVLEGFRGSIEQVPPLYSAVHVNGDRSYRRVRRGETVELKPRTVEISALELTGYSPPHGVFEVECSEGTYVRSIARDIAAACGTAAYVSELRRTGIGPFSVSDAVSPAELEPERDLRSVKELLSAASDIQTVTVDKQIALKVTQGRVLQAEELPGAWLSKTATIAVFDRTDAFLAVVEAREGRCRYLMVRPQER